MKASEEVLALWKRALKTLKTAEGLVSSDSDSASSRAYYAAFYAVSALFAHEDKSFKKHSGVEVAVHRDLVRTGRWAGSLGSEYTSLRNMRAVSDYGGAKHVSDEETAQAVKISARVLKAVHEAYPDVFEWPDAESAV